jgi:serine/threonine protein kinase
MDKDIIVPVYSATSRYAASFFGSMSIRPSRLPQDYNEANPTISQSLERFISRSSQTTTLEAVISVLKWTQLPGPVFLLGDREYVGSGSQFVVYKQSIAWPEFTGMSYRAVATKQPKISLDPDNALNLAHPEVRGHLQNVLLEILALRNPRLRAHPNIANLEAWSFEPHAFHSSIYLVMELADYNLASYLEDKEMELLLSSKYWICYDIAAGLDTLHGCKLIHGDLKPGNILLYRERGRLVAKLADFGMSVDGLASRETGARLGGTFGWQAPEVEASKMLTWDELPLADNYSFGLVIWSVLLHAGKPPPFSEKESRQAIAKREIEDSRDVIKLKENSCLPQAVFNLLNETKNRPLHLVELVERGADVDETR